MFFCPRAADVTRSQVSGESNRSVEEQTGFMTMRLLLSWCRTTGSFNSVVMSQILNRAFNLYNSFICLPIYTILTDLGFTYSLHFI